MLMIARMPSIPNATDTEGNIVIAIRSFSPWSILLRKVYHAIVFCPIPQEKTDCFL